MSLLNLDNLVKTGQLKIEPMDQLEFTGLLRSGRSRLNDAMNIALAIESRFDLAYNAAHSLSLAALRWHGYRAGNRYVVFQVLPHTIGVGPDVWRVLSKCHDCRNLAEYEGYLDIDNRLLNDLLEAAQTVLKHVHLLEQKVEVTCEIP
ncbi:MAG TPA: hypothetical protein VLG38_06770 [Gammaproteobacteria bacterium]|nr:hypothetical protein [Gammaproteobacteria bacterium]